MNQKRRAYQAQSYIIIFTEVSSKQLRLEAIRLCSIPEEPKLARQRAAHYFCWTQLLAGFTDVPVTGIPTR